MLRTSLAVATALMVTQICAQTFTNVANNHNIQALSNGGDYGGGVTFFDYNGDGWDDLTICRNSLNILRYKNINGSFEPDTDLVNNADAKQVSYADIDNDGDYDVLITRNYEPLQLLLNEDLTYIDITESSGLTQIFNGQTFGAAWADYDKDGFLDVYVCNYNWGDEVTNWLFHNNGDLTFTEVGQDLGVDNGSLTSFQAVWLDVNHDTWPDLYVVNDKTPPNAMFLNLGDGTFEDISQSSGSNIVIDGMTNTVADFNHDGLLDIYITDDGPANQLLQNLNNNSFDNVAPDLGVDNGLLCWGAQWIDWNNDGNRDLYFVTTTPVLDNQNYFYKQETDGSFTQFPQAFLFQDEVGAFTNAKADFDQNGYEDLILGCHTQNARLYQSSGGNNNYLRVGLQGVISNRDGIGSWITCYFNGIAEVEYTICGEAFMSQNSHYDVFGLGQAQLVDSLIVEWPSGHIDRFYDAPPNQTLHLIEGQSLTIHFDDQILCNGDSICIDLPPQFEYAWSTGNNAPSICLSDEGEYWVTGVTNLGIPFYSDTLQISLAPELELEVSIQNVSCYGQNDGALTPLLNGAVPAEEILTYDSIEISPINLSAGDYYLQVWDDAGCLYADSLTILQPDSFIHQVDISHILCYGDSTGSVEIASFGGTPPYEYTFSDDPVNLPAGELQIWIVDNNNCQNSLTVNIESPPPLEISIDIVEAQADQNGMISISPSGGTPPYQILWENGNSSFQIELPSGTYQFTLQDDHGCLLDSTISLPLHQLENPNINFSIYPIPAADRIHIQGLISEPLFINIYDLQGNLALSPSLYLENSQYTFHVNTLKPGAYIMYIRWSEYSLKRIFLVE